jgi:hypothetical protein
MSASSAASPELSRLRCVVSARFGKELRIWIRPRDKASPPYFAFLSLLLRRHLTSQVDNAGSTLRRIVVLSPKPPATK